MARKLLIAFVIAVTTTLAVFAPSESRAISDDRADIVFKSKKSVVGALNWASSNNVLLTELVSDDIALGGDTVTTGYPVQDQVMPVPPEAIQSDYLQISAQFLQQLHDSLLEPEALSAGTAHIQHVENIQASIQAGLTSINRVTAKGDTAVLQALQSNSSVASLAIKSIDEASMQQDYPPEPPDITILADPNPVPSGDDMVIGWDNPNSFVASCYDNLGHQGSAQDVWFLHTEVTASFAYSVHCSNSYGTDDETTTINVTPGPPPPPPPIEEWDLNEYPPDCRNPFWPRTGTIKTGPTGNQRYFLQQMAWTNTRANRLHWCYGGQPPDNQPAYEPDGLVYAFPPGNPEWYYFGGTVRYWADNFAGPVGYLDTQASDGPGWKTWTVGNADAKTIQGNRVYWTFIRTTEGVGTNIGYPYGQALTNWCGRTNRWCISDPGRAEPLMQSYVYPTPGWTRWWK